VKAYARYGGLVAWIDALVWQNVYEHGRSGSLYLASLVGSREATRGIAAALAKSNTDKPDKPVWIFPEDGPPIQARMASGEGVRIRNASLGKAHHVIVYDDRLHKRFAVFRERDDRALALWLSRRLGLPVPPDWIPDLEATISLPAYGVRAYRELMRYEYKSLHEEKFKAVEVPEDLEAVAV